MPTIKKRNKIHINSINSLEALLQELYFETCQNIKQSNDALSELTLNARPEDPDDWSKITKSKIEAIKEKNNSIKIKLDLARLQAESLVKSVSPQNPMVDKSGASVTRQHLEELKNAIRERQKEGVSQPDAE